MERSPEATPLTGALTCARCGAGFRCGEAAGDATCWCAALPPIMPLDPSATACLCPTCLEGEVAARVAARAAAEPR